MILFFIGVIEMFVLTAWTKYVVQARVMASGVVTVFNIFIWYFVLETIIKDIGNLYLITFYALGCAVGTMIATYYLGRDHKSKADIISKEEVEIPSTQSYKLQG